MMGGSTYLKLMWGLWGRGESVKFKITDLLSVPWEKAVEMTLSSMSLSYSLCQVGICDTLRSRQWEILTRMKTAQILKGLEQPSPGWSDHCKLPDVCLPNAARTRRGTSGRPSGKTLEVSVVLLPPPCVMFSGARGTSSSWSQPRCF